MLFKQGSPASCSSRFRSTACDAQEASYLAGATIKNNASKACLSSISVGCKLPALDVKQTFTELSRTQTVLFTAAVNFALLVWYIRRSQKLWRRVSWPIGRENRADPGDESNLHDNQFIWCYQPRWVLSLPRCSYFTTGFHFILNLVLTNRIECSRG